ncbi:hypothetical protein [Virgibacillus sp. DJP39]|uniref:hypothetical protein n=1 Tax=Virgibacillus sp. DJP39 TaxID=3409790 RepID=UPI003BB5831A
MKGIFYFVLAMMAIVAVALTTDDNEPGNVIQDKTSEKDSVLAAKSMSSVTISDGLDEVLNTLAELKVELDKPSIEKSQVKVLAEKLGEDWDTIEKQVEKKYPEDYVYIEKSLYPLLAEAQKEDPNFVEIQQLLQDTTKKINAFKNKLT